MSHYEKLRALLTEFGVEYEEADSHENLFIRDGGAQVSKVIICREGSDKQAISREEIKRWIEDGAPIRVEGETKISGYSMFYTAFEFDEDGEFIRMGAWE